MYDLRKNETRDDGVGGGDSGNDIARHFCACVNNG